MDAAERCLEIRKFSVINNCWLTSQFFLSHFKLLLTALCPRLLLHFGPAHTITAFQTLVQNYRFVCDLSFHGKSEKAESIVMKKTLNPELSIPDGDLSEFTNTLKICLCMCKVSSSSLLKSCLGKWLKYGFAKALADWRFLKFLILLKWMIFEFILSLLPILSKPPLQSLLLLALMGGKTAGQLLCLYE